MHYELLSLTGSQKLGIVSENILDHDGSSASLTRLTETERCSVAKLNIYVYNEGTSCSLKSSTQIELNRDSNELIPDTLQRIVLNLTKKLQRKAHKKRKQQTAPQASAQASSVWYVGVEADSSHSPLLEERDVSKLTMKELWSEARTIPLAVTVHLPSSDGRSSTPLCLLVESCPPTITSVRTFEDLEAFLFTRVPIIVQVDTLYATHCRVDWYVDGKLRQTTLEPRGHCFTPEDSDIGKEVALLISPFRVGNAQLHAHNGRGCEQAYRFQKSIYPLPENTLLKIRSQWLEETAYTRRHAKASLRVLTYNILANQNAFQSNQMPFYPYVPKEVLFKARRMPLILHEILAYHADVICLQEVDESVFDSLLEPVLTSLPFNYQGYYSGKASEGTREGCAIFWSMATFSPVAEEDRKMFAIQDLLVRDNDDPGWEASMTDISTLLKCRRDLHHTFTTKLGHVVQMVPLTIRSSNEFAVGGYDRTRPIWIANTHLFFHPLASHIRLLQMFLLARQLGCELQKRPGEVVLCGDFNSSLQNSAGKLLLDRSVPANFRDNKTHLNTFQWESSLAFDQNESPDDDFPEVSLPGSFPTLRSAVQPMPDFTHYIDGFQGTLDHILVEDKMWSSRSAPMPFLQDVSIATAMPSANLPSDHVSLVCDLDFIMIASRSSSG